MDPSAQDLMDSARDAHEPTQGDRARVRAKLALRVGAGAAVVGASATAKATLASSWVLKLVVPVLAAAAVGGYVYTHRSPQATTVQVPTATATTVETIATAPPTIATQVMTAAATVEPTTPHVVATNTARVKAAPATSADLEAETLALAQAQSAIQRGDFTGALTKLDAEEASFPAGLLTEERIAARVVALCGARRLAEGQTLGKTFLAKYPRSPLAPRVKSACAMP